MKGRRVNEITNVQKKFDIPADGSVVPLAKVTVTLPEEAKVPAVADTIATQT